MGDLEIKNC